MPRKARCQQKALCYHVMNRGVNRQVIFRDDLDRHYFIKCVKHYKDRHRPRIYHWALMNNHFHLLIEIPFDALRPFMSGLQQKYASYHHARHETSGIFWQARFKSKPVEQGGYLLRCGRYIERNAVRAGIVDTAQNYRWSSASFYVNGTNDHITNANPAVENQNAESRIMYAASLASGMDDDLMSSAHLSRVVGSGKFTSRLKEESGRYRRKRGRPENGRT